MTRIEALKELAANIEAGEWVSRKSIAMDAGFDLDAIICAVRAYHGSLDAAKALHEAVLPGWVTWDKSHSYFGYEVALTNGDQDARSCSNISEARAWLLAIISALIAQERAEALQALADADRDLI